MSAQPAATRAAIDWLTRQRDPHFADWAALTAWLEADPEHAAEYQRLMALDAALADALGRGAAPGEVPRARAPKQPSGPFAAAVRLGAAAAVLLAAFLVLRPDSSYEVATAAGQRKHILLGDGSRVVLNGGTRVRFDREAPRSARLEVGEALFEVVHDPRTRFRVTFEGGSVENLGTRFTVARAGDRTAVAVAEGAVAFSGAPGRAELRAGQGLVTETGTITRVGIDPTRVGSWATPRLTYDDAPLRTIAADLSRELGVPVEVAPAIGNRRFTVTIQLDLDVERSMMRLGALLDMRVGRRGDGWLILPRA